MDKIVTVNYKTINKLFGLITRAHLNYNEFRIEKGFV